MLFLPPDQIIVDERQRTTFHEQPLADLTESIHANGLIHPPAIRQVGDKFHLTAGERRLRACSVLLARGECIRYGTASAPAGTIPLLDLGELSDALAFEIELDENIRRENLTWQERAIAEARLLEIRSQQNAEANLPPPTITAIASEVLSRKTGAPAVATGAAITEVSSRINLAKHLDDPEVAKAKSEAEAVKIVRRKNEAARIQTLAAAHDADTQKQNPHVIFEGDFREHLRNVPDATFDVLLTDPPYGIDADNFGDQAGRAHTYEDSQDYFEAIIETLAEESFRVCKAQAHAYVFCDPRRFSDLQTHFELAGWKVWPIPLIWAKGNGMLPRPEHAPRRTYEAIMFASKGDKTVRCVKSDVIAVSSVRDLKHGAQKPVELYADLLSRSVVPGDRVLDCFAGSGTIFPAANRAKVRAVGVELDPQHCALAKTRMDGDEDTIPGLEALEV